MPDLFQLPGAANCVEYRLDGFAPCISRNRLVPCCKATTRAAESRGELADCALCQRQIYTGRTSWLNGLHLRPVAQAVNVGPSEIIVGLEMRAYFARRHVATRPRQTTRWKAIDSW